MSVLPVTKNGFTGRYLKQLTAFIQTVIGIERFLYNSNWQAFIFKHPDCNVNNISVLIALFVAYLILAQRKKKK